MRTGVCVCVAGMHFGEALSLFHPAFDFFSLLFSPAVA